MSTQPRLIRPGAGTTYQLGRITLRFPLGTADTGAAYTLCEAIEPPQSGAGLHRHPSYDETHIVCEGRYACQLGEDRFELAPGEMMFAPRGTAHSITSLGPATGRELIISSPGGVFDAFIAEVVAAMAPSGTPAGGPAADFRSIAARYGIEFLD